MNKALIRNCICILLSVIVAVIAGSIMMFLVYALPNNIIRANARKDAQMYEEEYDNTSWADKIAGASLDIFTDTLMINTAIYSGDNIIRDAMLNPRVRHKDANQAESLVMGLSDEENENSFVVTYARYWHGYLIYLKPLLCVFSLSEIRVVNMFIQLVLFGALVIELYKINGLRLVLPFSAAIFGLNPISTALCLQYSSVYYVTVIAALVMIWFRLYDSETKIIQFFAWIGISTAFVDLLTYPVAGLGVNLALMLVLNRDGSIIQRIKKVVLCSFSWGVGYAGMWIGKWIISFLLTGNNTLTDGFKNVVHRVADKDGMEAGIEKIEKISTIKDNMYAYCNRPIIMLMILVFVLVVVLLLTRRMSITVDMGLLIPVAIVALYPIVWYLVVTNHSAIHSWMTHRDLAVSICAAVIMLTYSLNMTKMVKEQKN
ncbi:hypothetical protein SAMN06296386_103206 [Lachnospiraceae bacterium]|nr:hypothetical protein SAMN06296386_103206 [Lachnospiraceae bacterium]